MRTSPFTEEHDQLRASVRRWVETELAPHADAWEEAGRFPDEVFRRAGALGFLGLSMPAEVGGGGGDRWASVVLHEELVRSGGGSIPMALAVQTDMATPPILEFGSDEQVAAYLTPALAGERIAALAITEPEAGSDVAGIRTRARREGADWVLDGEKAFITNGVRADFVTLLARTAAPDPTDPWAGLSVFLVDTDRPGFEVTAELDKVGMRASDTALLRLDGVRVPAGALLGEEGAGFRQVMWQLQGERLVAAIQAVAGAALGLERALAYAAQREAFGRPIGRFQALRHRFADLATRIEADRRLLYAACEAWDGGAVPAAVVAMLKLSTARLACDVADEVLQVHGGSGYVRGTAVERAWRDSRLARIGGGTDEVQREIVARLTGPDADDPSGVAGLPTPFGDEHEALRTSARAFVDRHVRPNADAWEHDEDFPRELFRRAGDAGFLGLKFAPRWGGSGPDFLAQAVWVEELQRSGAAGLAADLGAHSDLAALYVSRAGSDDLRERYLRPSIAGERIGCLAITEPDAGSDVAGIRTRARRDGDGWVLDGSKVFITNGPWADFVVCAAKVAPDDGGADDPHGQVTLFVVDTDRSGFDARRMRMLGWRTSHTGELTFDGVRVGDEQRLGDIGSGFAHIVRAFAWERVSMALGAVVGAEVALAAAERHARDRHAFGRPVGSYQVWRHRFADQRTAIASGRALTYHALALVDAQETDPSSVDDRQVGQAAAMAKLFTQRMALHVADECVQVHGGSGYLMATPAQRYWRDARLGPIGGGTDEIMREIVARTLGR